MNDYFYRSFPRELSCLQLHRPSRNVSHEIMNDEWAVFFGGQAWANVRADLSCIVPAHRTNFVLSLFMIMLTDQCLYTYKKDLYATWRERTAFPKFGWAGFGPHHENPFYLLWVPERENLIDREKAIAQMPQFVVFLIGETQRHFKECGFSLTIPDYIKLICQDAAYSMNDGVIIPRFKREFELAAVRQP